MPEMSEIDLLRNVQAAELDAINYSNQYMPKEREQLEYFFGYPNGYEVEEQSRVTSYDCANVVGSDMPSLIRVFLSGAEIMEFLPNTDDPADIQEAEEKTKYVHHIVRTQPNSFKLMHDWIKSIEIQTIGILYYYWDERKTTQVREYKGLDEDEMTILLTDIENEADRRDFEFESDEEDGDKDGTFNVTIKITRTKKGVIVENIPIENFLISTNAADKNSADLIGHRSMERRGDLIAQGFDKDKINAIPSSSDPTDSGMRRLRFGNKKLLQNGNGTSISNSSAVDKANELLVVTNICQVIDFDGDGIPERRHIIKIGANSDNDSIFLNEPFDHVPYAITSAILSPHAMMGQSRVELAMEAQLKATTIGRQMMDDIYDATGRLIVNDKVDMDDLLTNRLGAVVRTDDEIAQNSVFRLEHNFIGDKILLIMQSIKADLAQSTGELLANQGLEADKIYAETATRFEGIRDAGAAKVGLVARVIAENGFKDLFEGIAWLVSHFQSSRDEITVLKKKLTIDPTKWWNDHHIEAQAGLGAGDDETVLSNMSGLLQIQNQLKAEGSALVDEQDRFNVLKRIVEAMGENQVSDFFNDPDNPEQSAQFLMEQNEKLMQMIEQFQQQGQNPLAEAELVKQQGAIQIAQDKLKLEVAKLEENQRQFDAKQKAELEELALKLEEKYSALEAEFKVDIAGKGANG